MEVLINGLNTYLGSRAASHLQDSEFTVNGIVRNLNVFNSRSKESTTAELHEVDLIRKGKSYDDFYLKNLDIAFYFTQVHDFSDKLTLNLEIISLKNYIQLIKINQCKRLVYVARLMDKNYVSIIEQLFKESEIDYTIVLKNVAIGKGSVVDAYIKNLLKFSYVPYVKKVANINFRPIAVLDVLKFIKTVTWKDYFARETVELGGPKEMTFQSLFSIYATYFSPKSKFYGVNVPKFILDLIHKRYHLVNGEDYMEFNRLMKFEYPIDNTVWVKKIPFHFTPISHTIRTDC
ncbi:hypothetical protein [Sphingobacterium hungaricum]|uniref:Uncharacterized protein n=1 Tax=Sphingobacterium hungaricum TaxID=2082723 RepID=A0A928UWW3_9SPHI|nr:hypothetical protein [Sphingobacterium hungaricum]MBE8712599.1 hypothetical protein [Sphingobacterium hungaricum]